MLFPDLVASDVQRGSVFSLEYQSRVNWRYQVVVSGRGRVAAFLAARSDSMSALSFRRSIHYITCRHEACSTRSQVLNHKAAAAGAIE